VNIATFALGGGRLPVGAEAVALVRLDGKRVGVGAGSDPADSGNYGSEMLEL